MHILSLPNLLPPGLAAHAHIPGHTPCSAAVYACLLHAHTRWDYGYQTTAMANRTVIVDNNTWNTSHIATVGRAMASPEAKAWRIYRSLDVEYVFVVFGGMIGYSSDDINKFLWMVGSTAAAAAAAFSACAVTTLALSVCTTVTLVWMHPVCSYITAPPPPFARQMSASI